VIDVGLAGHNDREILEYSEKNDLILISGDKVILLRYRLINIDRIVKSITKVLDREEETFRTKKSVVIVLSEAGYRVHKPGGLPNDNCI